MSMFPVSRLRKAKLSPHTAPGKVHKGRPAECIGKQAAQEMPGSTYHKKSYPLSCAPSQSVCLSDVCWKLSGRNQTHDCPQWPAQPLHRWIENLLSNELGGRPNCNLS